MFDPTKGDPLPLFVIGIKAWLRTRVRFIDEYWLLGIVLSFLFFGSVAIASLLEGIFLSSENTKIPFLMDIAAPIHFAVLNPLVIILILKYYERLSEITGSIENYFNVTDHEKKQLIVKVQRLYAHKLIIITAVASSMIGTSSYFYYRYHVEGSYLFIHGRLSWSGGLTFLWGVFVTYFILVWMLKTFIAIPALNSALKYPLRYQVFHPDRSAGLGGIDRIFTLFAIVILVVGLILSLFLAADISHSGIESIKSTKHMTSFLFGVPYILPYIVLAPSLYLIPLWNIHKKMKESKTAILTELAENQLMNPKAILDFYAVAKELPEWPATVGSLSTLAGSVITPIIIPLITKLLKAAGTLG